MGSGCDRVQSEVLCGECKFFGNREYLWGILRLRDEVETIRLYEECIMEGLTMMAAMAIGKIALDKFVRSEERRVGKEC